MLSANHLSFRHGDRRVLQDISLNLLPGQLSVLMGPNGCGKTTLLHLLAGVHKPELGTVNFSQQSLSDFSSAQLARKRCLMSQQLQISFPFRVDDVVAMGAYPFAELQPCMIKKLLSDILEENNLIAMRERFYHSLSGGEQQRCQFARAMLQWRASVIAGEKQFALLLDEPTSAMDLKQQLSTLRQVRRIADQGAVVCAILHDINLASLFADQLIFLSSESHMISGDAKTVCHSQTIKNVFAIDSCQLVHPEHDKPMILPCMP
jgi:iron complex transport system ATP-binding protein